MGDIWDKIKGWWDDIDDDLKEMALAFLKGVSRETIRFIMDNKEFIAKTILDTAVNMATASNHDKRHEVLSRMGDGVANNIPNLKVDNSLLRYSLEYVYRGLKEDGQISG